jgi:hypothetical protein
MVGGLTEEQLPLMRTFFDRLDRSVSAELFDFATEFAGPPATANVERVLLTLEQIRTSPDAVLEGWAEQWKSHIHTIKRQLADYALTRLDGCHRISDENWAAKVLAGCGPNTTVISMNYDNVAEIILSNHDGMIHWGLQPTCPHCKMRHIMEKACSCAGHQEIDQSDWRGALLKPHGSIAWKRCLNPECCSYECLVADARCMPFEPCPCPHCECDCAPVMVMPTMTKNLDEIREIGIMWKAARQAIADASSIVLFGFSMPASDELLIQMIRAAILSQRKICRVREGVVRFAKR